MSGPGRNHQNTKGKIIKKTIALLSCLVLSTATSLAIAKKPEPPSTVNDYDITSFTCPASVTPDERLELRIEATNVGPADPGVVLQAREEDALPGPTVVVNQVAYDSIENGRKQKATEYVFYVSPSYLQSHLQWSANLYDENHVDDLDGAFCNTQIIWN